MSEYDDVAQAISRGPGGYQTRSGRTPETIRVKGGTTAKGWVEMSLDAARALFKLPPTEPVAAPKVAITTQPAPPPRELEIPRPVRARSTDG